MSLNISNYIPEGTRDYLYEDCYTKICIENKLQKLFMNNGYDAIASPALEYYDVFIKEGNPYMRKTCTNCLKGQEK